ncbi:hypothetical protein EMCRGX_G001247 [Ephydatia muelleri]
MAAFCYETVKVTEQDTHCPSAIQVPTFCTSGCLKSMSATFWDSTANPSTLCLNALRITARKAYRSREGCMLH